MAKKSAMLAKNLKQMLSYTGESQIALSKTLGLKPYGLRDLISHPERTPRENTIEMIAKNAGVTAADLMQKGIFFFPGLTKKASAGAKKSAAMKSATPKLKTRGKKTAKVSRGARKTRSDGQAQQPATRVTARILSLALKISGCSLSAPRGTDGTEALASAINEISAELHQLANA